MDEKETVYRKIIGHKELFEWLKASGLVIDKTRRVIIDICVGQPTRVYVEGYGSTKMLQFAPPTLDSAEIEIIDTSAPREGEPPESKLRIE
jgi:hypothetical protein